MALAPAHGVLVTSATLTDGRGEEASDSRSAEMRTGGAASAGRPMRVRVASPFDYAGDDAGAFVVTDVDTRRSRQVAAAYRELFLAAGGGGLGFFTAIRRLRAVHERIAAPLAAAGLPLSPSMSTGLEVGTLVDIFRAEEDACLLGTDAVRDGVDVPGRSLRLLVFDRVPWPRPDILHKARRGAFGGKDYDDALARGRLAPGLRPADPPRRRSRRLRAARPPDALAPGRRLSRRGGGAPARPRRGRCRDPGLPCP